MSIQSMSRIDSLNKENYDTWKIQMEALSIKNDAWQFVNGESKCPPLAADGTNAEEINAWKKADARAKSDLILSISPSELKQIKGCGTSHDVWVKLQEIYQSKGPARKATLLKQLTLQRMPENGDVREHMNQFFDAVDKLSEMDVEVNKDLLAIMLLYSLPHSYENFRCAIESRDNLPDPSTLRIKITEESDARNNVVRENSDVSNAMIASNAGKNFSKYRKKTFNSESSRDDKPTFRCFKCKKVGHKASNCRVKHNESAKFSDEHNAFTTGITAGNKWCLDSGATSHLCRNLSDFAKLDDSARCKLNLATNCSVDVNAKGTVQFKTKVSGKDKVISLENTLHVPELRTNLLSISKITDKGHEILFKKDKALVRDLNGTVKLVAKRQNDLYFVDSEEHSARVASVDASNENKSNQLEHWHRKLGHLNVRDLIEAHKRGSFEGLTLNEYNETFVCSICPKAKMTQTKFPKKSKRETEILDIIHSDVCGPMRTESLGKARYFVTFTDDASKWTEVRFIRSKDEVLECFKDFVNRVENLKGKKVKYLQSDNGGEYTSKEFEKFLKERGIARRLSIPHTPEQNGVSERKNRSLQETARCLLYQADLPTSYWAEAVNTACYLRNRCPTKTLKGKTPYEIWNDKIPNLNHLREFGCKVICLDKNPNKGKFEPRGVEGIFVGYSDTTKGYRVWISDKRRIEVSRDVKFLEPTILDSEIRNGDFLENHNPISEEVPKENKEETERYFIEVNTSSNKRTGENENPAEEDEEALPAEPQRRKRRRGRPKIVRTGRCGRPSKRYNMEPAAARNVTEGVEHLFLSEESMKSAMSGPNRDEWLEAMMSEIVSIMKNDTWTLTDRPERHDVIGCRMTLRNKPSEDGTVLRRKARLVAQGFSQRPGIHFNQTFAPVARISSVRMIISLAARFKMDVHQLDVATAYLNGELQETIFMEIPKQLREILEEIQIRYADDESTCRKAKEMLLQLNQGDKVCRLNKSLYGLRQAGRSWHAKLDQVLQDLGATPCKSDPCVYQIGQGEASTLILIYVDDIIIASVNKKKIEDIKDKLSSAFEIKDLGKIGYYLGIEFSRQNDEIVMKQTNYITDLLAKFNMENANVVKTPMDPSIRLVKPKEPNLEDNKLPYRELIGALTYLAVTTRPDISHAISKLAQYNNCYNRTHWLAAKRVLRYLKGTKELGLVFKPDSESVAAFVDADWGGNLDDRRSFTGFCIIWNGGPINWDSRKQRTVALSTNEAEYMALGEAAKEAISLGGFLKELGLSHLARVTLFNDNQGALKLVENSVFHARSKHIDLRHHFIRDALSNKLFEIKHVPSEDMTADVLTKGLPGNKHWSCLHKMGMR